MQTKKKTFGVTLYCREQKIGKDGTAPVEVTITISGEKASFQLKDRYVPSEFKQLRDSKRINGVRKLCGDVTGRLLELRDRHPESGPADLKDFYINGDPLEGLLKKRVLIRDLCDAYLNEMVKGTPSHDKYKATFNRFKKVYGFRRADSITTGDVRTFLLDLRNRESFSDGTLRNYRKRLKSLFAYGYRKRVLADDPTLKLRMSFTDKAPVFLTTEELARIQHADLGSPCLERVRDAFFFMCGTGLEYTDVKNLTPGDVKRRNGVLYIEKPRVKTGVVYIAPLVASAPSIWEKYSGHIPLPANQVINRYLKKIAAEAKIDKNISTLTARHTFSTLLASGYIGGRRVPVEILMRCLGHTNLKQSLTYASLTDESLFNAFSEFARIPDPDPADEESFD